MAHKRNRFASQAKLDALVRFGPEISGLKALIQQAYTDRSTGIQQARGTARGVTQAIDAARPQVASIYDRAGLGAANTAKTLIGSDLAGLGSAADAFKAGSATEQAGMADRFRQEKATELGDLSQQRVAAQTGKQWQIRSTQQQFVSEVAKVLSRRQDLAREQGAFQASEVGKLRQAHQDQQTRIKIATAGNQQSERNSLRSAGINPDTGAAIKNGPLDPNSPKNQAALDRAKNGRKPKVLAPGDQQTFNTEVGSAITLLKTRIDPHKQFGRQASGDKLINGAAPIKGKDSNQVMQTLVPEVKPHEALAVRVANDMYYDGHLSPATIKLLRANGVRVKAIPGIKIWTDAQRARQRAQRHPKPTGNWLQDMFAGLGAGHGT